MSLIQSLNTSDDKLPSVLSSLEAEKTRRLTENKLAYYRPYAKQKEFHDAGKTARERLFMAANRVGKTLCGAAEMSIHLTGLYPSWWDGRRFDKPIRAWGAGVTGESVRDVVQEPPKGAFPGKVAEGWYCVVDKAVVLTDQDGKPLGGEKRPIEEAGDPKLIACRMLRERQSGSSGNFSNKISYPKLRY